MLLSKLLCSDDNVTSMCSRMDFILIETTYFPHHASFFKEN